MVRQARTLTLALAAMGWAAGPALAGETAGHDHPSAEKPSPQFEALKALAGEWEGTARPAGEEKVHQTRATYKVVSAGSAVMLVTDPGTPHEMVTMFHRDDDALMATHYCAAMNQPRMKARSSGGATSVTFEFVDGTNLGAHPGRMQGLVLAMPEAGKQTQTWTYRDGDKTSTMVFDLVRKKEGGAGAGRP
jgi:hypothetical protein